MRWAILAALVVCADARAELRPRYGGSVEATLLGAPATLDPVLARSHADATVAALVFDTLYQIDDAGVPTPRLAAGSPTFDEKRTTARIDLVKGALFHDGTPVTPQDVAASLERTRQAARWALPVVTAVAVDGDAIVLSLSAPTSELSTMLALPQTSVTKGGKPPGAKIIGSGPFAIEQLDVAHRRLALRAFDDYAGGRPYIDHLELRWYNTPDGEARRFETGNAHVSTRGVAAFSGGQPTFAARDVSGPAAVLIFLGFGATHAALERDPAFRHALDLAIARGALTSIGNGERVLPTRVPLPPEAGGPAIDSAGNLGDLVAAKAQLAEAASRVADLRSGSLRLEILVEDSRPDDADVAERVGLALDKLGIAWTVTTVTAPVLRDRVKRGQCDLWIGQLAEPVASAAIWWSAAFAAGDDDSALAPLEQGADPSVLARSFADRQPIVPLMFRSLRLWHRTDLKGLVLDAMGRPCFADAFLFGSPVRGKP
ncbi:MAG TPA: ABC transporter substrate-binding protein [Kofleriaceae bacterium]|jgi:ABC-type transport system substrate-binding protein